MAARSFSGGVLQGVAGTGLHVRGVDSLETVVLPDTGVYAYPFFSPDGQWLAYRRDRELVKSAVAGGTPSRIQRLPEGNYQGCDWSPDGWILISVDGALYRVSDDGSGPPELLADPDGELGDLRHPYLLPGERTALVTLWRGSVEDASLGVVDLASGDLRDLHVDGSDPQYLPTGHLVWVRDDALLAAPFDVGALEVVGPQTRVQEGIEVGPAGPAKLGLSASGTLAYSSAGVSADYSLVWLDRQGNREPILTGIEEEINAPRLSPDGRRIAMGIGAATLASTQLWIYEIGDGALNPLTTRSDSAVANFPIWAPDGATLFYMSFTGDSFAILRRPSDFTGSGSLVLPGRPGAMPGSLTPDGRELALALGDLTGTLDVYVARTWARRPMRDPTSRAR